MFFKKKKPDSPPEAEHQANAQEHSSSSAQSLFAPGLNPNPAQIDFGFGSLAHPPDDAYPEISSSGAYDPWLQPAGTEPWQASPSPEQVAWQPSEIIPPMPPQAGIPVMESSLAPLDTEPPAWQSSEITPPFMPDASSGQGYPTEPSFQDIGLPMPAAVELTPEQAWSQMEVGLTSMGAVVASEESEMPPYGGPGPVVSPDPSTVDPQDEWAAAFDSSTPILPVDEAQAPPASFTGFPDFPTGGNEDSGLLAIEPSSGLSPDFGLGQSVPSNLAAAEPYTAQADFDSGAWSSPPAEESATEIWPAESAFSLQADTTDEPVAYGSASWDMPVFAEPSAEETLELRPSSGGLPAFDSPLSASVEENSATFAAMSAAPPEFSMVEEEAVPATSLDALWEPSLASEDQAGDLHARFSSSAAPQPDLPTWDITAPHLALQEAAPDFSTVGPDTAFGDVPLVEIDPVKASQELAVGWERLERALPVPDIATASGMEAVTPTETPVWADENVPPPMSSGDDDAGWANLPPLPAETVYFHEEAALPQAEEQLWSNLSAPAVTPGEQVPYTSGAMMDAINEQLYPADPFGSVNDEFSAGEQAFAEAARYLFPETVSAPLDWTEDGDGAFFAEADDEDVAILDLGPSYSRQSPGFSDLPSGSLPTGAPAYAEIPNPEAFSGVYSPPDYVSPEPTLYQASERPLFQENAPEDDRTPQNPAEAGSSFEPETLLPPAAYVSPTSFAESGNSSREAALFEDVVSTAGFSGALSEEPFTPSGLNPEPLDAEVGFGGVLYPPAEEWADLAPSPLESVATFYQAPAGLVPNQSTFQGVPSISVGGADMAGVSQTLPLSSVMPQSPPEHWDLSQPQATHVSRSGLASSAPILVDDEADFYATAFGLNEQGELIPLHEEEMLPAQPMPGQSPVMPVQPAWMGAETQPASGWANPVQREELPPGSVAAAWATDAVSIPGSQPAVAEITPVSPEPRPEPMYRPPPMSQPHPQVQKPHETLLPAIPGSAPEQFLALARKRFVQTSSVTSAVLPQPPITSVERLVQPKAASVPNPVVTPPKSIFHPAELMTPETPVAPEPAKIIRPKPLSRKPAVIAPAEDLETQWYNPEEPASLSGSPSLSESASQEAMAMKLTLGNLEVMGLCQIAPDKRLLVVHHDGIYALMAQCGQEQSDVNVLKVFEHNPLAYQHTFTAVQEGNAGSQGMYVAQVGTWHAIISTFQDKITLHTELG